MKNKSDTNQEKIIDNYFFAFTNQEYLATISAGAKWYANINKLYKNILTVNHYNVIIKYLRADNSFKPTKKNFYELVDKIFENEIYIFNPIDFAGFLLCLPNLQEKIFYFLDHIKYIVIWQEILLENFDIVGYQNSSKHRNYIFKFFNNSILNIVSNSISINSLEKNNIKHNKYFTITGYSLINNIIPFVNDIGYKDIDVFIYGTIHETYTYRNVLLSNLTNINNNKYNIQTRSNLYGEQLDLMLKRTKLVVHIPSHPNLTHMPWPKITYLQAKKIFFIIEDNDELHQNNLDGFIICYHRNNIHDLFEKIEYFLKNEEFRKKNIDDNYDYILKTANMDKVIPDIIKNLVIDQTNILPIDQTNILP